MANIYDVGDRVRLTGTFTASGSPVDPTTVTLYYQDPSGNDTIKTYALGQLTKVSTGVYRFDLDIDEAGKWYYRFAGTGACVTASESHFNVRKSEFD